MTSWVRAESSVPISGTAMTPSHSLITGVPTVDTEVAQHLLKTVSAARLLGAECIVSGIRPQVAQTIVSLGIEFGDIATKATLADALAHALDRRGRHLGQEGPA